MKKVISLVAIGTMMFAAQTCNEWYKKMRQKYHIVGTKAGMSTSDITMLLGSNALTASSVMLNVKTEEEQIKYNRFMKELQYSVASLQNEFRRYDRANPDTQFDLDLFLLEDIDEFYKRTVSTDLVTMMGIMEDGVLNYDANNFLNLNLMPL
jgi:hypothetical protein